MVGVYESEKVFDNQDILKNSSYLLTY